MEPFKIKRFRKTGELAFEGEVMTVSEVHLQESINLKKLCRLQNKKIKSLYDLIELQREKLEDQRDFKEKLKQKEDKIENLSVYIDELKKFIQVVQSKPVKRRR